MTVCKIFTQKRLTFDQPGSKEALARQLFDAIQNIGFFYIANFGLSQEEFDRQFAIGKSVFELPTQKKLECRADLEHERFARHIHSEVVQKLLALFALLLELPENYFAKHHRYGEALSDCHLRYMKYHARDAAINAKVDNVRVKRHTDFGSLTLLFRQPAAALQVRGERWVRPHDGSIAVNIADALEFLSNRFLKSSIHRVVGPPPDQAGVDRLGALYFVRPEDDLELRPVQSRVLENLGYGSGANSEVAGITAGGEARSETSEQEIVKGVEVRYYD
ncbi:UPF0676 protein [Colletotrichum trifolii]|uniref:UPF0676 protein n=1 Tax=Colletotrichum trifolii TaxID=5466 RepID=A0A4R8RQ14_COLTR|nr:UPF0676 protein [Colletotrichum trifolii]